ncbi:heterocyst differentiation related protein [Anabaena subtropica]|uniref:Heterocyst differentiation related protein n=1 Tax=Anabaena subtropica FACHB-260 TaxID=2692884 RepID=A0ABR8CQS3_9NOST|nr:heterocyst differentiation related protein [Anabaena subtropica]MBD2345550.1 heterocyst differentiation related protein [Anabaena subtropica FACHB-260]
MSESMAFIGGVAVAGLAALLMLRGTSNSLQPNFGISPQMPATIVAPQGMPPQYSPYGQVPYNNPQPPAPNPVQSVELERLKMDFERLKSDNEQLRAQNQQLQFQFQNWNNNQQMQLAQQNTQRVASAALPPQSTWWSSPIVWAAGGATLTIGGGVVVAGVLSLFSPRSRPTRTVQVIHPYQGNTQPLVPVRRAEFLPPGMETRRVEAHEYDEMR